MAAKKKTPVARKANAKPKAAIKAKKKPAPKKPSPDEVKKTVKELADELVKNKKSRKPKSDSGGEEQRADIATRFQKGNQMWKKRSKHGRDQIIESPEILRQSVIEYLDTLEETQFFEEKSHQFKGLIVRDAVAHRRPPTLEGLRGFLGICRTTWKNLTKEGCDPDFVTVVEWVEDIFFDEKLAGAAAGVYNSNIIARDLKLKDHQDHTTDGDKIPSLTDFYGGSSSD